MGGFRNWGMLSLGVLVVILLALPQVLKNSFAIDLCIRVLLFSFIAVAWNLIGGYAKQAVAWSLPFSGLGAILDDLADRFRHLALDRHGLWWRCCRACELRPIGWLCFRLRGPYFAIATIATAQVLMLIFLKFRDLVGAEGTTIQTSAILR